MAKYIDADLLRKEIDRQKIGYNTDGEHAAEYNTCRKILEIIGSLQQEQQKADLEKEDSWKPTEVQIEALEFVICDYREDSCNATANYLQEILDHLKNM